MMSSPEHPSRRPFVGLGRASVSRTLRGGLLATGTVALLALAACSGGDPDPGPTVGEVLRGAPLSREVADAVDRAGSATLTLDGAGFSASGALVVRDDGVLDQRVVAKQGGQVVEVVRTGDLLWARGLTPRTAQEAEAARTRPWRAVIPAGLEALGDGERALVGTLDLTSPRTLTTALTTVDATVTEAGTDHLTVTTTVPPQALLGDLTGASGVTEPVDLTVVLDADRRPLRLTADLGGQPLQVSWADWGGPDTRVTRPPAAEVG